MKCRHNLRRGVWAQAFVSFKKYMPPPLSYEGAYIKSGVETFSQKFSYSSKIYKQLRFLYCFHDQIRIYFMSFIVQISPFVHLFTLAIVSRWGASPLDPHQGSALSKNICPLLFLTRGHIFFE
jgi:hypothetical protein